MIFGNDVKEDLWFAWRLDDPNPGSVYCFQEDPLSPPPRKVASDFVEFLEEVALGDAMKEMGLKKLRDSDADRNDDDDDDDYVPPKEIRPLPGRRGDY